MSPPRAASRSVPTLAPAVAGFAGTALGLGYAAPARATNVMGFPDNGTEPMSRGGAWVARASNPLATFYNPAGLAGQKSGVLLDTNIVVNKICFQRSGPGSKLDVPPNGVGYSEVCNSNSGSLQPLPALAAVLRVTDRLGIGLSIAPPSVYGTLTYPETVTTKNGFGANVALPAGQRYILLEQGGIALNTTLGAGYEVLDNLRIGAGFIWGLAKYKVANANMSVSPARQADGSYRDPVTGDVRADFDVADWFIPGVTVGVLYSPIDRIDVGANVIAQEAFDGHGDLTLKANYWTNNGISSNPAVTKSSDVQKGLGHFRVANPLEAHLGGRYHHPRSELKKKVRDPFADDVFDVEVDLSYTRNSAYERAMLRFPKDPVIQVQGTPGIVPENNDFEFRVKGDTVGLRVGGEYVVLPAQLAVRAGGWYEPNVSNDQYANVAFLASQRIGVALGGAYRIGPVDVEAGYMHVFFKPVDNGGNGKLLVVSGDATSGYRSPYPINGGRFTESANIFSLGATARF